MPLGEHANNDPGVWIHETDLLGYYIKVYMMADKYYFPSVRLVVVEILRAHCVNYGPVGSAYQSLRSKMPDLPEQIAYVCGPDAPQLADSILRDFLFDWFYHHFGAATGDSDFVMKLEDGSLLDAELTTRLLLKLGARIRLNHRPGKV
jgi:hypothetical protein